MHCACARWQFETVFNVCLGFTPYIDNYMHMGGFFAGFFLGLGLFTRDKSGVITKRQHDISAASLTIVGSIFVLALTSISTSDIREW